MVRRHNRPARELRQKKSALTSDEMEKVFFCVEQFILKFSSELIVRRSTVDLVQSQWEFPIFFSATQ